MGECKVQEISRDFLFNGVQLESSDCKFDNEEINDEQDLSNHDEFDL